MGMKYATPTWTPTPKQLRRMQKQAAAAAWRLLEKADGLTVDEWIRNTAHVMQGARAFTDRYVAAPVPLPRPAISVDKRCCSAVAQSSRKPNDPGTDVRDAPIDP
jgi:hypothetical protein